jgi:hypothetical protein
MKTTLIGEELYKVIAQAQTAYNYANVNFFGTPRQSGSWYTFEKHFNTYEEAVDYLADRIMTNYLTSGATREEFNERMDQLERYGSVEFNGVLGSIDVIDL